MSWKPTKLLFGSLSVGVTNKRKNAALEQVTVNAVSEEKSLSEIKKKHFNIKQKAKNCIITAATGGG